MLNFFRDWCGAKNDKAHKGDLPRIRQAEQRAENRKRGEMFKTG